MPTRAETISTERRLGQRNGRCEIGDAAPAAQAAPIREPGTGDTPLSTEPVTADSPAMTTTIDEGFDWGSAAIGAGGAGALIVLVSLGGFKLASRDRVRIAH